MTNMTAIINFTLPLKLSCHDTHKLNKDKEYYKKNKYSAEKGTEKYIVNYLDDLATVSSPFQLAESSIAYFPISVKMQEN